MTQLDCFDVVHCYVFSLEVSTMSGQILSLASIGLLNSVDNCLSISPLTKHHSSVCHSSFSERNFIRYQGDFLPISVTSITLNPDPPHQLVGTSCLSMISTTPAHIPTSHIPYNLTPYIPSVFMGISITEWICLPSCPIMAIIQTINDINLKLAAIDKNREQLLP